MCGIGAGSLWRQARYTRQGRGGGPCADPGSPRGPSKLMRRHRADYRPRAEGGRSGGEETHRHN
eukprot:1702507-Pyramimonas_sp.AAC.1